MMSVTRAHVKRSEWVAKSRDECGALWEKVEMTPAVFFGFFQADAADWQKEKTKGEEGDKTKTKRQQQHQKKENKTKQNKQTEISLVLIYLSTHTS